MVGDRGFYVCSRSRRGHAKCGNAGITAARIDEHVLTSVREVLLSRVHFEAVLEATRTAYADEIRSSSESRQRTEARAGELDRQIDRLVELYARGTVSPDVLEPKIRALEDEKRALTSEAEGLGQLAATLDCAAELVTEERVREYADRFERLARQDSLELLREFVGNFVDHIDVEPPPGRRKPRRVLIHGKAPGVTRIDVVSPTGFEPVLPP